MSSVPRDCSSHTLLTFNNPCTVCCGRQLPTKDTRKIDALVLYKALYIFCDSFIDEATAIPAINTWYKCSKSVHCGLFLAINTSEIGLTTEDLNLFSNFSVLTKQLVIAKEEISAEKLFLASIQKNIQSYLLLGSSVTAISRLERKEELIRTAVLEGEHHATDLESILQYTELRRFTVLEAIVQTIRSKKISTSSQKFLVCSALCTVKDWIKSDKCKRFNLPAASLQSSFSSFTSATVITPLQDDALSIETDLEIISTEIIPHMKNSQLSTSPPLSPIYPTTSAILRGTKNISHSQRNRQISHFYRYSHFYF